MAIAAVLLSLILVVGSITTASAAAETPLPMPSSYTASLTATILSALGFQNLSAAAANFSGTTPTTIFGPMDSSLLTCPSCSIPLLLREHSVLGLYPLRFLRTLAFGTRIGTLAADRCLTVTSGAAQKVFINGVEITKPDLFNNGLLIVHALQGFVSHLSPLSCAVENMTTLSFPQQPPPTAAFLIARSMLKDAMTRLRVGGYSLVALAMRLKYSDLSDLRSMTLFAIDDESIFLDGGGEGRAYVADMGFHIVPNMLLTAADLIALPRGAELPTMESGRFLVVTSAGDGGPLAPTRINFAKVKRFDVVRNQRIVVHGLSTPLRHVDHPIT